MEFIERSVPKNFNVFFLGDLHIGSSLFHEAGFQRAINSIKRRYKGIAHNVVIGMGDYIEAIDTSDKRFDLDTTDIRKIRPELQMEYFIEQMRPIRKKIVTLLYGNHEHTLLRYYDYVRGACKELKVPFGTYSSVITFVNQGSPLFKVFATHGRGLVGSTADSPERRIANMKLQLKRKLWNKAGDCVIMAFGHTHKLLIAEPEKTLYLTSNGKRVKQHYTDAKQLDDFIPRDHRYYVNTGSLLRLFGERVSGYAERAMYDPVELGYPVAMVRDGQVVGVNKVVA